MIQRKVFKALALLTCSVSVHATNVHANEAGKVELEEIKVIGDLSTYSATKSDIPILETPRSVTVEDQKNIEAIGALNLADTYTYSAGVIGETFGFATRGDFLNIRGFSAPQFNDSLQTLFGDFNNTRTEIYTVEQVEVLKGPASVLFGKGAPGGIVNIVSKKPQEIASNEIVTSIGNFDYRQVAGDFTGPLDKEGKWLYRLVSLVRETDTQVDFVNDDSKVLAPSLTYRPSEDTEFTVLLNYTKSDSDTGAQFLPIAGTLVPAQNGEFISSNFYAGEPEFNKYDGETKSITLLADHQFNDVWSIQANARRSEAEIDYNQAWISFGTTSDRFIRNPDGSLYEGGTAPRTFFQSNATSEQSALDLRLRGDFSTGLLDHNLLIGTQYQDITTDDDQVFAYALGFDSATQGPDSVLGDQFWINAFNPTYGNVPSQELLDLFRTDFPEVNTKDFGLYLNDQISFNQWRLNVGLRYDEVTNESNQVKQDDDAVSISTGLLYAFDNGLSPYISYAESFEPVVGTDSVTNAPFDPQEGRQYEAGLKYKFKNNPGFITLSYFDIEQSNLLAFTVTGQTQAGGIDTSKGWELEAKYKLNSFLVEANLSSIETETSDGFQFFSTPEDQASFWLSYAPRLNAGFSAGLGTRYVGDSFGGSDTIRTPSYTLFDAMLAYDAKDWQFRVNARNLADKEYQSTCLARGDCFAGERRTIVGNVTYKF